MIECDLPESFEMSTEKHYSLSLKLTGLKEEELIYSLSKWLTLYPNVVVNSHETSEPNLVFEGVDTSITFNGSNF